ncbi:hypothetical protein AK812_SmicGene36668 [Symbiodinium microadriaticum]|uniref:Uncharacterized protein n=1 Tax=Symbiodinium microadriaticum TaxID=2951 RepID=A0A1Q9CIA7_SYMMI|nr:hypothetical protein AK812_SmicGene36668 [Symbiodinium microadriaticum]
MARCCIASTRPALGIEDLAKSPFEDATVRGESSLEVELPCMEKYVYQRCSDLTERNDLEEAQPSEVPEFNGG